MPFDGISPNAQVVELLNALLDYFRPYQDTWVRADTDLSYALKLARERLKIRWDTTRKYIIEAAKTDVYVNLRLCDLNWMVADYESLENILLRARDLASGEPMRKSTWVAREHWLCDCTGGRSSFLNNGLSSQMR